MRDGHCAAAALVARLAVFAASVFLVCWAIHGFAWGILKDVNGYDSPYTPAWAAQTENLGFLRLCSGRFPSISTTAEARGRSCSARFRIRDGGTISPALRPSRARRPKWQSRWDLSRWQRLAQFRACGAGAASRRRFRRGCSRTGRSYSAGPRLSCLRDDAWLPCATRPAIPAPDVSDALFPRCRCMWSLSVQCTGSGQTVSSAQCAAVLRGPMPRVAAAVVLLTVQVASALAIAPHYLAYFSPIAGGPTAGYRLLADSNIDWGQDLPLLRAKLEQMGCRRALLRYSGTANPEAYGVARLPWIAPRSKSFLSSSVSPSRSMTFRGITGSSTRGLSRSAPLSRRRVQGTRSSFSTFACRSCGGASGTGWNAFAETDLGLVPKGTSKCVEFPRCRRKTCVTAKAARG